MGFGSKLPDGHLPVFSTNTEAEAQSLLVLCCPRDAEGHLYARELAEDQTLENLQKFSDRLQRGWELMQRANALSPSQLTQRQLGDHIERSSRERKRHSDR